VAQNSIFSPKIVFGDILATKWDTKTGEQMFVVQEMGVREVARHFGVSPSAVSAFAKREDWIGKRMAYKSAIARRSYESMADQVAAERTEIARENVLAARATIRRYLNDLAAGKVGVTAKDAELMMRFLVQEMAPHEGPSHEAPMKDVTPPDHEFLKRVIETARGKVAAAPTTTEGLKVH
jgi:hypothetical protein